MSRATVKTITPEDIFLYTNNGLDIFRREITNLTLVKNILSPVRNERNPSFRVKESKTSGLWIGADYTTGEIYNAITFIQRIYNLSYREAIDKIASDFGLKNSKKVFTKAKIIKSTPKISESVFYEYSEIKFNKKHHEYWNAGELTEEFLRKNSVYAANKIAINKKVIKIPDEELCFVYVPDDLPYGKLKILRINTKPSLKWRTNINRDYFFYEPYIKGKVPIAKSNKDALINKLIGIDSIAVMSENAQVFTENYSNLRKRNKGVDFFLNWGIDKDAIEKVEQIQEKIDIKDFKIPKYLLNEGVNDNFEFVKQFGLKQYEKKIKNFIKCTTL